MNATPCAELCQVTKRTCVITLLALREWVGTLAMQDTIEGPNPKRTAGLARLSAAYNELRKACDLPEEAA